jgi:hypothetical protein
MVFHMLDVLWKQEAAHYVSEAYTEQVNLQKIWKGDCQSSKLLFCIRILFLLKRQNGRISRNCYLYFSQYVTNFITLFFIQEKVRQQLQLRVEDKDVDQGEDEV